MPEDIRHSANRHVGEIKAINRDLIEKALSMRCHAYLSQIKSQLLTQTIFELDKSKKVVIKHRDRLSTLVEERAEEMQRINKELQRSNEELENFTAVASHDLKEPIRKIISFGDRLIETEPDLTSSGKSYVERMQKSSIRMKNLIEGMLEYSRVSKNPNKLEPIDLRKIVNEVLIDVESNIKSTQGRVNIYSLPTVQANPSQMRQLFQNLICNALKYHREGVAPVINLTSSRNDNGTWIIRVEDNGIGFEEQYKERIFKMFERLHRKSEFEGTGIGLAICQRIVLSHHGTIEAESVAHNGATFIITLPENQY
jgi:two-component system, LuxR family, sensor kinase FixL